jgi:archaellum component FlaC
MANTERIEVIKAVRKAKKQISRVERRTDLIDTESVLLRTLYLKLDEIEDDLILKDIGENIDAFENAVNDINLISADIKENIQDIDEAIEWVEKASKGVGVLVNITTQAAKLFA